MEIHLFTVIALLLLGVAGLSVGVANDAVNFLNSSVGSKVAPFKTILFIAALGILFGVTFSSGMMEVARKGIFNPEHFILAEILIIFFAVMIQNILLLDLFNTFGLPTSTTVSMVFGLFGGSVAMALIKIFDTGQSLDSILLYINTSKVLAIFTAIFISVVFAFVFGFLIQYLSRLLFTFDFDKRIKRYGAVWGGFALTFIAYFIIIKGAKGASFMTEDTVLWIKTHTLEVLAGSFIAWLIILQALMWLFKVNVLKIVVLAGTFAIAMAFAANDLVNFIGAPLAGLNAYTIALGFDNPETTTMGALSQPFKANTLILLASGTIMVFVLFVSKKSRTVSKTEISLGRQDEGYERFDSYMSSRVIVRMSLVFVNFIKKIIPTAIQKKVSERFDLSKYHPEPDENGELPSFDFVRAAVNLVVAAALISYGTSLKLPLSTTYVTFIVAMSTALPDKAWGRESAVYRVSGVLTVIGGWFFTGIMATIVASIIAVICYFGGVYATIGFLLLSAFLIYRSNVLHKNREKETQEIEKGFLPSHANADETYDYLFKNLTLYFKSIANTLTSSYTGIFNQDLKVLNKARRQAKKIYKKADLLVGDVLKVLKFANEKNLESGHSYAKALGALHEISSRLLYITKQNFDYFDNNHNKFQQEQIDELKDINKHFNKLVNLSVQSYENKNLGDLVQIKYSAKEFEGLINKYNKNQLKRIKKSTLNKRRSMLYLNILDDTQGMIYNIMRITEAFKEFYEDGKK
ncbi:MAG: inorganic phosphate transporter [bacterium]